MNYRILRSAITVPALLLCTKSMAQTALPYATGFDTDAQKTGWQEFKKGTVLQTEHWGYTTVGAYSAPNCLLHNYPVGGTTPTENWFVSPGFTLGSGGKIDSLRYAFSGFGTPAAGDTVALYLLKGSADPALATSRTLLFDFRGASYNNDNTWRQLTNITIPATTGSCYLALQYRTVVNWLDVRFDNLKVRSNTGTDIGGVSLPAAAALLYPNPAGNVLYIKTAAVFTQTRIYDITGKTLYQGTFQAALPISALPPGNYMITCNTAAGDLWKQAFVKQ